MTKEGGEYGRRRREGTDEETDRIMREIIDEIEKETEKPEFPNPRELPEQVYNPEQVVREAIEEIQQEEAERLKLEEQKESKEEPQEHKEKREIPEEWDVDECVRTVIKEVQEEEAERQRLREEREHAEMEKEQQLEASYESRKESADKDELEEYEENIRKAFEEHGIDPEEVRERWRKKFEEEVQDETGEESRKQTKEEDDESAGSDKTAEGRYYYDDGSGQVYEVQMDSNESSETESQTEVKESQEEPPTEQHENTESKKDSDEIEPEKVTPTQETEDVVEEKSKKEVRPEQDEIRRLESEEIKQEKKESTKESVETSSEEHHEHTPETSQTPEKGREESSSTPETNTKRKQERSESEGSQDTEENVEEKNESREKEIWTEYEIEYGSLEDENYKKALREIKDLLPEEEQEKFNESVREKVQTVEDFEELARKHGLDELLEDEEVMEEIRNYLKVRSTLEQEPDTDIKKLAEEMEIDAELAEEWSRGESEPYSLKKLLNLEAFYMWDEIIRNYQEQNLPQSREELESILESKSELKEDRFFELERDDATAYVEIMAMRRRGEIKRKIRNGREVYSRKQIMELSKKYGISASEIIKWLRGEQVPLLISKVRPILRKKNADIAYHHLMDAYREMYFYFRTQKDFNDYIRQLGDSSGISNHRDIINHINRIAPQITTGTGPYLQSRYMRIKGELLFALNRSLGRTLSDLDGKISKLTKRSGKGGIQNPKFPSGLNLEIAIARLVAVAVSDCHLKPNGTLEYFEPRLSRIRLVEKNLQVFGDITLNPKLVKRDNVYVSYFPAPLGKVLQHWGWPSGDKAVQNPGLFSWMFQLSLKALAAFIEDLVPQDGSVSSHQVSVTHSNALHPAAKGKKFHVTAKVGRREIEMIKDYGKREKHCWVISLERIKELREHNSKTIARTAIKFRNIIYANPNKLIMDEERIAKLLGIKVYTKPQTIRYHIRSGRVSVAWYLITENIYETIKLAIIAPPNDKVKRNHLRKVMLKYPKRMKRVIQELTKRGVEIDEWWK